MIVQILSLALLIFGVVFILVGGLGVVRLPDIFLRLSATTKTATLGVGAMLLGTALYFGDLGATSRAFAVFLFILVTAPLSAHMIARAAYADEVEVWEETVVDELVDQYDPAGRLLASGRYARVSAGQVSSQRSKDGASRGQRGGIST